MNREAATHALLFCAVLAVVGVLAAIHMRSFRTPQNISITNGGLAKALESHYEDHFPAKQLGVNLWAAIDYTLFNEGRRGVIVGTRGWLYTDEEFHVPERADATLRKNLQAISSTRAALSKAGVQLITTVVPSKARVYAEFLDDEKPAQVHTAIYDTLLTTLASQGIPSVDLRHTLTSGKSQHPTYFQTDTHWTPHGARLAATEIARVARASGLAPGEPAFFVTRKERRAAHRGDLCNFLPLAPYFSRLLPPLETLDVMRTDPGPAQLSSAPVDLFGDSDLPQVVLVGTSYSANPLWNFIGALKESLGADIASYARQGAGPFKPMTAYLQSEDFRAHPPSLVIWEIPERTLLMP